MPFWKSPLNNYDRKVFAWHAMHLAQMWLNSNRFTAFIDLFYKSLTSCSFIAFNKRKYSTETEYWIPTSSFWDILLNVRVGNINFCAALKNIIMLSVFWHTNNRCYWWINCVIKSPNFFINKFKKPNNYFFYLQMLFILNVNKREASTVA